MTTSHGNCAANCVSLTVLSSFAFFVIDNTAPLSTLKHTTTKHRRTRTTTYTSTFPRTPLDTF